MSFTEELLRKHADLYAEATVAAPFICKAAEGKLEKAELVGWLYQDLVYARSYIIFVSRMLQNVITDVTSHTPNHKLSLVSLLGPSISAISAEIGMMQKLVEDLSNGEATNLRVDAATTQYSDYLCSFQHSQDPIPALTCLWTMERCFLDVWSHVKDVSATSPNAHSTIPQLSQLVHNWTKPEFRQWVQELEKLLNDMRADGKERSKKDASRVFEEVLLLERDFWPDV